jgi:hypothetical protein
MTDPEREHFVRQIHDLERRLRRWRLACLLLLGLLLLPVVLGGLLGVWWVPRLECERAQRALYEAGMERARDAELRFWLEAEEARQEAERQRVQTEKETPKRAQQGPGDGKD